MPKDAVVCWVSGRNKSWSHPATRPPQIMGTPEFQLPKPALLVIDSRYLLAFQSPTPQHHRDAILPQPGQPGAWVVSCPGGRSYKPPVKPPKRSKSDSDGSDGSNGASDDDEDQDDQEDGTPGTSPRGPMNMKPTTDSKATPQDTPSVFKEGSKEDPKATYLKEKKARTKPEKFPKDSDKEADDKALESKSAKGEKRPSEDKDELLKEMEMKGKKSKTAPGVGMLRFLLSIIGTRDSKHNRCRRDSVQAVTLPWP